MARRRKLRLVVYSLIPPIVLLALAEGIVRVAGLDVAELNVQPLEAESAGLYRRDRELFWSLRPGLDTTFKGAAVVTNDLGLRSAPIGPRAGQEFRVLSLGESTTFGIGVEGHETYSAVLAEELATQVEGTTVRVINAGVPAYSSFQSLKYLETRGLALDPDLVLFYHEVNDYLPSTLRDSSNDEFGVTKTDAELHAARGRRLQSALLEWSALLRFIGHHLARRQIESFDQTDFENPLTDIGLPDIGIGPRLVHEEGPAAEAPLNEQALGQRVSEEERRQVFEALVKLCDEHAVTLVVIHPSYRFSSPHECLLTRFCAERDVLTFDAHDSLHPPSLERGALFLDMWHPVRLGHRQLGRHLARQLLEWQVVE